MIVSAGLQRLRHGGLKALSMRTVAQELGVGPMSLYRHVRNKAQLVELMMTSLTGQAAAPTWDLAQLPWTQLLPTLLGAVRGGLSEFPGAAELFDSSTFQRTAAIASVDAALASLKAGGLNSALAAKATAVLWMYTIGSTLAQHSPGAAWPGEELSRSAKTGWVREIDRTTSGRFPNVAEAARVWTTLAHDEAFALGLRWMLSGLAKEAATPPAPRRAGRGRAQR